ncbi:hypothetical protein L5D93_20685 [Paenibacillus thiaminolyticus]|nr:hypothetical protein [Paenibacillus thiaminolyticus]
MDKVFKKILVGVTGTIGSINVYQYILALKSRFQCQLDLILTKNAKQFVSTLALVNLCDHVYDEMFVTSMKSAHVTVVQDVDLFIILPASANFLSKMAHGSGDDLLSCCVLNYRKKIYIAPNMNNTMWTNPRVQQNVSTLKEDGHLFVNIEDCGYKASTGDFISSGASLPQPQDLIHFILNSEGVLNENDPEINT